MLFVFGLPPRFAKLSKSYGKFESFGKEFRWTKFIAVEWVTYYYLLFITSDQRFLKKLLSKTARTISEIEKRREFARALCYQQCTENSFKRLYIVKELLFFVKKASFSKEFLSEFEGWT